MLEVLPSRDPVLGGPPVGGLVEEGQGFVEVVRVDVGDDLPEYLAVLELVPCCDAAGEFKGIDLWANISYMVVVGRGAVKGTYPVQERFQ